MTAYRKRKNQIVYAKHTKRAKKTACEFCKFSSDSDQVVDSTKHFWIVKNLFPYDFWDYNSVLDHLMVVPKRHIDSIGYFTTEEATEYTKTIGKYEKKGYSVYARAPNNIVKSVPHQHTHLISIASKPKRLLFYIRKPHILISK